jgi:hypothetical protein
MNESSKYSLCCVDYRNKMRGGIHPKASNSKILTIGLVVFGWFVGWTCCEEKSTKRSNGF